MHLFKEVPLLGYTCRVVNWMWAQIASSKVELVTSFKFSQSSRGRQTANELDRTLGVRIMEEKRCRRKIKFKLD